MPRLARLRNLPGRPVAIRPWTEVASLTEAAHLSSESERLIAQYRQLHALGRYGDTSIKRFPAIVPLAKPLRPANIIDFGCGQSRLAEILTRYTKADVTRYDPAIPDLAKCPTGPFDLLISVDVLEHIPYSSMYDTLAAMRRLSDKAIIIIDTRPSSTILANGQNAHVSLFDPREWLETLRQHWSYVQQISWVQKRPASFITWQLGRASEAMAIAEMCILQFPRIGMMLREDGLLRTLRRIR